VPPDQLLAVAAQTDLLLYDLKIMDDALHRRYTGVGNELILNNLKALSHAGATVWVRIPLIPGINDDDENIEATAAFLLSLETPYPINLLPYHKVGGDKYRRLGETYLLNDTGPPPPEYTSGVAQYFRARGLEVKIGG
jgi:pyruvate formate lyase activating enzyme